MIIFVVLAVITGLVTLRIVLNSQTGLHGDNCSNVQTLNFRKDNKGNLYERSY